jgi:hypothetical protein
LSGRSFALESVEYKSWAAKRRGQKALLVVWEQHFAMSSSMDERPRDANN